MKSIKVCEYSRSRSFHYDLILQDQASGERSQDQWSSGFRKDGFNRLSPGKICIVYCPNKLTFTMGIKQDQSVKLRLLISLLN